MQMDQAVKHMTALLSDLHGYIDTIRVDAGEVYDKASKLKGAAEEYDQLCHMICEKKAEIKGLEAEMTRVQNAYNALKALVK